MPGKCLEMVRNAWKALEIVQTTFKRMPHFFTDDNLITTLCSVHRQLHHRSIAALLIEIES